MKAVPATTVVGRIMPLEMSTVIATIPQFSPDAEFIEFGAFIASSENQ